VLKRLVPLIVAIAVGGAPVALDACQVACTWSMPSVAMAHGAGASSIAGGEHSCHDKATGSTLVPHALRACGHRLADQLPASTVADGRSTSLAVPVALVACSHIALVTPRLAQATCPGLATRALLPGSLGSAIPLRI
jgi:hypothetical protein